MTKVIGNQQVRNRFNDDLKKNNRHDYLDTRKNSKDDKDLQQLKDHAIKIGRKLNQYEFTFKSTEDLNQSEEKSKERKKRSTSQKSGSDFIYNNQYDTHNSASNRSHKSGKSSRHYNSISAYSTTRFESVKPAVSFDIPLTTSRLLANPKDGAATLRDAYDQFAAKKSSRPTLSHKVDKENDRMNVFRGNKLETIRRDKSILVDPFAANKQLTGSNNLQQHQQTFNLTTKNN